MLAFGMTWGSDARMSIIKVLLVWGNDLELGEVLVDFGEVPILF